MENNQYYHYHITMIYENKEEQKNLLQRFIRYAETYSQSDSEAADKGIFPSTEQQKNFAKMLYEELKTIGFENVTLTEDYYVYASLSATSGFENINPVCLIAHMDTSEEVSGKDVKPILTEKDGDTIISTGSSTLLGADDKAGLAEIITAVEYVKNHPEINHGLIEMLFSPDEETGHGMDKVPLNLIKSKCAVTVDGGELGEFETECFNAYAAKITFTGNATHTGTAKKEGMINSLRMMSYFIENLPKKMLPETTENYQGFIAPLSAEGSIESSTANFLLRSFSMEEIEKEKSILLSLAEKTRKKFGGIIEVKFTEQYRNMKEKILTDKDNTAIAERVEKAYRECGIEPKKVPIRGGTDGSRLTEMGIPTPNIFTGGHNFHSRNEWASLNQMCKAADILIRLVSAN